MAAAWPEPVLTSTMYSVVQCTMHQVAVAWPEPLFPFLLVNMGSGVSVVRVDGDGTLTLTAKTTNPTPNRTPNPNPNPNQVRVDGEDHFARVGGIPSLQPQP